MDTLLLPKGIIPNELLAAEYKYTAQEIDLLMRILTEIRMRAVQPWYELPKNELASLMNEGGSKYENLRRALIGLQKKPMEYWNKDTGALTITNIVSAAQFNPKGSSVKIHVIEDVATWIKATRTNYTEFNLTAILKLRSKYSKLLYLKATQWLFTGQFIVTPEQLRTIFSVGDKYQELHNFRARILKPALEEVNELTELDVTVTTEKNGREVNVIRFDVSQKGALKALNNDDKLHEALVKNGLADWQAKNILATIERADITAKLYDFQCNRHNIKNKGAYLRAMFQNMGAPMSAAIPVQLRAAI